MTYQIYIGHHRSKFDSEGEIMCEVKHPKGIRIYMTEQDKKLVDAIIDLQLYRCKSNHVDTPANQYPFLSQIHLTELTNAVDSGAILDCLDKIISETGIDRTEYLERYRERYHARLIKWYHIHYLNISFKPPFKDDITAVFTDIPENFLSVRHTGLNSFIGLKGPTNTLFHPWLIQYIRQHPGVYLGDIKEEIDFHDD